MFQLSTFPQLSVQPVDKWIAVTLHVVHLRTPSFDRGLTSFLWGLGLGVFLWLGMLAVGVSGATAFIFGALSGCAIFLYVRLFGEDELPRQSNANRRRAGIR